MATHLSRGMAFLNARLKTAAAETVRYIRGAHVVDGETIQAVPGGLSIEQILNGEATLVGTRSRWSFKPDAIRFNNQPSEPRVGDRIELHVTSDHDQHVFEFEVMPADGERCWMPMGTDNAEGNRRIFVWTKFVAKRAIP